MKTEAIREALEWMQAQAIANPSMRPMVESALAEVDAIEQAVHDWHNGRAPVMVAPGVQEGEELAPTKPRA